MDNNNFGDDNDDDADDVTEFLGTWKSSWLTSIFDSSHLLVRDDQWTIEMMTTATMMTQTVLLDMEEFRPGLMPSKM